MVRFAFLCLCVSGVAFAQVGFGAGVKGGFALPGWYQTTTQHYYITDGSSGFTGGPYVEARLGPFSVDAEALYRKIGAGVLGGSVMASTSEELRGSMWRVPVLARMRLPQVRNFRPFVEAGPSFMRLTGHATGEYSYLDVDANNDQITVRGTIDATFSDTSTGLTFGAGIERRIMPLRVTFEGRMTRWHADDTAGWGYASPLLQPSQFEILFGIGF